MKHILRLLLAAAIGTSLQAQQNSNNFKYLDINRVKAGISSYNLMHWDAQTGNPSYEVPQGSGLHTSMATVLWFGGIDNGGQLRVGAQNYRQSGVDFWPGPLNTINATTTPSAIAAYDKVWKVSYADINNFITNHVATNDIITWPGSGNVSQNQDPILAPFIDVNTDGIYNSADGDYPDIKGDQAIFAIFNDNGGAHTASGSLATGVEIHLMAYAYGCPQSLAGHNELAYTTFYNYKIINRGAHQLYNFYAGLWSDADLGYYMDDYTGCDVQRSLAYLYNGDGYDESVAGSTGYGNYPPAQGILMLKGPNADIGDMIDNDRDGCVDCTFSLTPTGTITVPDNILPEQSLMNNFGNFDEDAPQSPRSGPLNGSDYYGYMNSHWRDGSPFTCGGNGYGGSLPTHYMYPGNTDPNGPCGTGWTEITAGNVGGDRRIITNCGYTTLRPGDVKELEYAFITSFDSTVANNPNGSLQKLFADADKVRNFYNMPYKPNCYQGGVVMGVKENSISPLLSVYPNPAKDLLTIDVPVESKGRLIYEVTDVIGNIIISSKGEPAGKFTVPVSGLTPGVYFIRLGLNGQSAVKKFIKE